MEPNTGLFLPRGEPITPLTLPTRNPASLATQASWCIGEQNTKILKHMAYARLIVRLQIADFGFVD